MGLFDYAMENWQQIWTCLIQHLKLTGLAVLFAVIIGVPLGILINSVKVLNRPVMAIANLVQAIPSLALLGFLIPLLGIGTIPSVGMAVVYSLLPIVKNTSTGLRNIDQETEETARGIGLTAAQVLLRIKLPLALPIIMAGIRISAVTAVGLVTLAAFIGAGGLGYLVYSGIRTINTNMILSGAVPACLLALAIDHLAAIIEGAVTPISMRADAKSIDRAKIRRHRIWRSVVLAITALGFLLVVTVAIIGSFVKEGKTVTIGSKAMTEQVILGHIYAELIEAKTDIKVNRYFELGSPRIVFEALKTGEIDMYPEYTGSIYTLIMKETAVRKGDETYRMTKEFVEKTQGMVMLDPIGFNNTYIVMTTKETAEKYNLKNTSDLVAHASQLIGGFDMEFMNRKDGLGALVDGYGIKFKETVAIDGGAPKYLSIVNNQIDASDAFSTDGVLLKYNLALLKDDKELFLPYHAVPLVKASTLEKYPELRGIFNSLAGKITDEDILKLNYQVDVEQKKHIDVAKNFLKERKML